MAKLEYSTKHRREERSLSKYPIWPIRLPKERAALHIGQQINPATFVFNLFNLT